MYRETPTALLETASQELFDYFALEVFQTLDRDAQHFLLTTSILTSMTEALARDLTDHAGGRRAARSSTQNELLHDSTRRFLSDL